MWLFGSCCDRFHVASRLAFKLELDPSRESLLHFFEVVRRAFPGLTRFRRRPEGGVLLEEEVDEDARRQVRVDSNAVKLLHGSPDSEDAVMTLGRVVFTQAPYDLSLSDLDYDYMEVSLHLELDYRGNHDELIADTLLAADPLAAAVAPAGRHIIDCQPIIGIALSEDCGTQAYVEIRSRTSAVEVRTGEYDASPISVSVTVRRYWSTPPGADLVRVHDELVGAAAKLATERVVPQVVQPLAAAIASRR
ncbi:MAG: hypothetical protein IPM64_12080 [Phycisphaerales bacterium]|nr:hypothetical protein [Phycisphaerales bacterium]